jgi:hypothetical protein
LASQIAQKVHREDFFLTGNARKFFENMEPLVGFEPTTYSLRMNCSTPELQRHLPGDKQPKRVSSGKREIPYYYLAEEY